MIEQGEEFGRDSCHPAEFLLGSFVFVEPPEGIKIQRDYNMNLITTTSQCDSSACGK